MSRCVDDVCGSLMKRVWGKKREEAEKHMHCVHLWANEWKMEPTVCMRARMCVCVCPGTCEVVCGRQEGKLIKPMIALMRSQGVKPEKAFHFLSDSILLFPTSIYQSLSLFWCFLRPPCWELIGLSLASRMSNWTKTKAWHGRGYYVFRYFQFLNKQSYDSHSHQQAQFQADKQALCRHGQSRKCT